MSLASEPQAFSCRRAPRLVRTALVVPLLYGPATLRATSPHDGMPTMPVLYTRIPVGNLGPTELQDVASRQYRLPDGSEIVLRPPSAGPVPPRSLTPDFVAAGRADVSFDGRRILFVGKRAVGERFRAWEMNADGSDLRVVSDCPTDCLAATYLSTMYTLDAEAPVYQVALMSRPREDLPPALYTARLDGTRLRRITFHPGGAFDPVPLSDGRLLFAAGVTPAVPASKPSSASTLSAAHLALLTVFPDGTDLFPYADRHAPPAMRLAARPMGGDRVVLLEMSEEGETPSTRLRVLPRTGSLLEARLLAPAEGRMIAALGPLDDRRLLVSAHSPVTRTLDLFELDVISPGEWTPWLETADAHETDPVPCAPSAVPAGRSSVVRDDATDGELLALDVYLSDGTVSPRVERGRVHSLRVWAAAEASRSTDSIPRGFETSADETVADALNIVSLGTVPVAADGSFYAKVPAQTPLKLETLDESGRSITAMTGWFWVMPGERRGCIGCHEDRERTPPNRHVLALRKPPRVLQRPPEWIRETQAAGSSGKGESP